MNKSKDGKSRLLIFFLATMLALKVYGGSSETSAQTPKSLMLVTSEFKPYMMNRLDAPGLFSEIVVSAYKKAGYAVKVVFLPWKRAVLSVEAGKYDGLVGANHSQKRAEFMLFSDAVIKADYAFFALRSRNITYQTLSDLSPYRVGYLRGGIILDQFHKADWLRKEEVRDHKQALNMLRAGRIDLILSQKLLIPYHLKEQGWGNERDFIDTLSPNYGSLKAYTTVSKHHPEGSKVIKHFNEGLRAIVMSGEYQKILKKYEAEIASVFPKNP